MDTIKHKYKGKRVDTGEWVVGDFVRLYVHSIHFPPELKPHISFEGVRGVDDEIFSYEVDPETVGLCTGEVDKRGEEIFEGDLVKSLMTGATYIVRFGKYKTTTGIGIGFWKEGIEVPDRNFVHDSASQIVIGNVHED